MVLSTFDVENEVLLWICWSVRLVDSSSQFKNLLFRDGNSISMIKATQVNMLCRIIVVVDLIEDLPGNIKLNPLSYKLHIISIISFRYRLFAELHFLSNLCIEFGLALLHLCVEDQVILVTNPLISHELLLISDSDSGVTIW